MVNRVRGAPKIRVTVIGLLIVLSVMFNCKVCINNLNYYNENNVETIMHVIDNGEGTFQDCKEAESTIRGEFSWYTDTDYLNNVEIQLNNYDEQLNIKPVQQLYNCKDYKDNTYNYILSLNSSQVLLN